MWEKIRKEIEFVTVLKQKIVADYVDQIRKLALQASSNTGLSISYVISQAMDSSNCCSKNCWNIWQTGKPVSPAIVAHAYKRFIKQHGNKGKQILHAWNELQKFQALNITVQQHLTIFNRETKKIKQMLDNLATVYNFQSTLIFTGGVVNQDQDWCTTHQMPMSEGFLQLLIKSKDEEVIQASFKAISEVGKQYLAMQVNNNLDPARQQGTSPNSSSKTSALKTTQAAKDLSENLQAKESTPGRTESATKMEQEEAICNCILNLFGTPSGMKFHIHKCYCWRALGKELAKPTCQLILLNWPEKVGFPHQKGNKGIAELTVNQWTAFCKAVHDKKFPLSKRSWSELGHTGTADTLPRFWQRACRRYFKAPMSACSSEAEMPAKPKVVIASQHPQLPIKSCAVAAALSTSSCAAHLVFSPPYTQYNQGLDDVFLDKEPLPFKEKRPELPDSFPMLPLQLKSSDLHSNQMPTKSRLLAPPVNSLNRPPIPSAIFAKKRDPHDHRLSTSSKNDASSTDEDDKRSKWSRATSTT
ncbi:hypothetical protein CVT24_013342 [Panaeolus cyanescens]|uniref:Uncharacterized protein n=1 Tax=Panaeolus cyanescens TaxID=181874 RepID=A0A409X261_9AGAR|nr:hypothetical protein CVT24_013342 [Panaeolus cyanescens]